MPPTPLEMEQREVPCSWMDDWGRREKRRGRAETMRRGRRERAAQESGVGSVRREEGSGGRVEWQRRG